MQAAPLKRQGSQSVSPFQLSSYHLRFSHVGKKNPFLKLSAKQKIVSKTKMYLHWFAEALTPKDAQDEY